ncbi:MAG: T9SS type A sorting domain-containing protein [Bacteroidales bacterium]|nr:T9SS type A sorting domain-containing protein [Bacteroidales bacterium]
MKKIALLFLSVLMFYGTASAQPVLFNSKYVTIHRAGQIDVSRMESGYDVIIKPYPSIKEGNETYRQHMMQRKLEVASKYPKKSLSMLRTSTERNDHIVDTPVIINSFEGNHYNYSTPNDNTLAISNSNNLISAINTNIYFFDLDNDTISKKISLQAFSSSLTGISNHQYDPRVIYDPDKDRFIVVFLAGASSSATSHILVGFSDSPDMLGSWNLYALPGNPLPGDTSWTDFPAIALTGDELFITANLLKYGGSWQTSFKQSVVWQIDKMMGYRGDTMLNTRLWHDINFDGENIRNIFPVRGGGRLYGPDMYLLSNRNFSLFSDSIFLLHITGTIDDPGSKLTLNCLKADPGYGMPPDAEQPGTKMLATNDARVLGGFFHNNSIQFVFNSIDTATGLASVYHGIIDNVLSTQPFITGAILSEPPVEYGYPNISWSGNTLYSRQAIIGVNHSADTVRPGVSAIFYDGNGGYSRRTVVKKGVTAIKILSGNYERWGDYTGSQRKYNEPGKVWISGMYGFKTGNNWRLGTHIAELASPVPEAPFVTTGESLNVALYPNPFFHEFATEFVLEETTHLVIDIFDLFGRHIDHLFDGEVQQGKNTISFNTYPLAQGTYILQIKNAKGETLFTTKVIAYQ